MITVRSQLFTEIELKTTRKVNRTGAALARGDLVVLDVTGSDGDVEAYTAWTSGTDLDLAHPLANVIAVASAHLNGWLMFLVAMESIANDAVGLFACQGIIEVEAVGGSAIASGGLITGTNAQTYVSAAVDGGVILGQALEAGPTGTAPALTLCAFKGGPFCFTNHAG